MPDAHSPPDFRPRLRPNLRPHPAGGGNVALGDVMRVVLSPAGAALAEQFRGRHTLAELAAGTGVPLDALTQFAAELDAAYLFDSPALAAYLDGPTRLPACVGCYPDDPAAIRDQLDALYMAPGGPGLPGRSAAFDDLRAVLVPHMDYGRGGVTYGWGFRELFERTRARLFVIVATSHYSAERFTLTRQHFQTPLGVAATDRAAVDFLAERCGPAVFADRIAHMPEHSIELEVVMLQHLFPEPGAFRIVPLLVGSFHDCIADGIDPATKPEIARMVGALREWEAACGEPVCYVISGDLAHIGPKFGDPEPVGPAQLEVSRARDAALLTKLADADAAGYFAEVAAEGDARRICGLPPTWVALQAARPSAGRVLHYGRHVHPQGYESVSFAAAGFTR